MTGPDPDSPLHPSPPAPLLPPKRGLLRGRLVALCNNEALACLVLALWALKTILAHWNQWAPDLSAVYIAGWLWDHGQPGLIYSQPEGFYLANPPDWADALAALGERGRESYPFIYPPGWAALMAPVTRVMGIQAFFNVMAALQITLLAGSVLVAARLAGRPLPWLVWVMLSLVMLDWTIPLQLALHHLQPSLMVTFLILLAFERLQRGRPVLAGSLLGLAVCIKLTPLIFAVLLLPGRQVRALVALGVTCGLFGLISLLAAGFDAHLAFLASLSEASRLSLLSSVNLSVRPAIEALMAALGQGQTDLGSANSLNRVSHFWVGSLCLSGLLLMPLWLARRLRPLTDPTRFAVLLMGLATATALFGPLGWQHYYILPMLLLPALFGLLPPWRAAVVLLPVLIATNVFVFLMKSGWAWPDATYVWLAVSAWLTMLVMTALFAQPASHRPMESTGAAPQL